MNEAKLVKDLSPSLLSWHLLMQVLSHTSSGYVNSSKFNLSMEWLSDQVTIVPNPFIGI